METSIKEAFEAFPEQTQMAIGALKNGQANFEGYQKVNGVIQAILNSKHAFEISSITKVFTTNILAQLVLENKVKLSDEVATFLPLAALKESKIRLLHLANHTSGLPRLPDNFYTVAGYLETNPYLNYDETCLLDYLNNQMVLASAPGETFAYSNFGFGLLSYLLSKIEDKPFEQIVANRIFQPLGMDASTFDRESLSIPLVQGLNQQGGKANNWDGGILKGALGILTTVEDLSQFAFNILDKKNTVANLQTKPSTTIQENRFVGLGWGIRHLENGNITYNHGGGSDGFSTYLKLNRKQQNGIIILSNISAFHPAQKSLETLSSTLLESLN